MDLTDLLFPHYEDHRGNFRESRLWLGAELSATENTEKLFDLMLWEAKVQMMQGEIKQAEENFAAIAQLLPDDHHRLLLLKSLELLLMYEKFNRFPNGAGSEGVEIGARWQGSADMQQLNTEYWEIRAKTDNVAVQWAAWYISSRLNCA